MIKTILLILITIFLPPVGVFLVAGCGADLLINILLTILGYVFRIPAQIASPPNTTCSYFPGHIHAFYIEYVYIKRRDEIKAGIYEAKPAPGVYSQKVQNGGHRTVPVAPAPVETGAGAGVHGQQQYGAV